MDAFLSAVPLVAAPTVLLAIAVGAFIGLVFGAMPGLTFSLALAVVLPMTFAMDMVSAVGMLLGTYIGGMTGGSVAAILIGIPGTPSAAATVLDGYPMARQGKAGLALGTAVVVSVFGGLFSLAVMIVSVDIVARIAIRFGPAEIFALVLFGLSTICGLAEKSLLRGLIAGVLGLLVMTIGLDPYAGIPRMTFGTTTFMQGIHLLVAMVGLFAVPQIIHTLAEWRGGREIQLKAENVRAELPSLRQLRENFGLMVRSAAIGTGIGAIPGAGGPIAAFLAYDQARRFSKNKENFGKGELSGVVAPEAANNAVTGGTMIPLLSLGIPGDPATAIILGGLLIHGLAPGPLLFTQHGSRSMRSICRSGPLNIFYQSAPAMLFFGLTVLIIVFQQGVSKYLGDLRPRLDRSLGEVLRVYTEAGVTCAGRGGRTTSATRWRWRTPPPRWPGSMAGALRGRHLDRPRRPAGVGRLAGRRLQRRRRLSHLRRRDDLRRRLQHAADPQAGAAALRPDDGADGRSYVLHTPRGAARRAAPRRAVRHHPVQGRAVLSAAAAQHAAADHDGCTCRRCPSAAGAATAPLPTRACSPQAARPDAPPRAHRDQGRRRHPRPSTGRARAGRAPGAAVVLSPGSTGVLPDAHPQNMHVGGSQGLDQRQFRHEPCRRCSWPSARARCARRLLRHRLQVRRGGHQHQRRPRRRAALQQHAGAAGRHRRGGASGCWRHSRQPMNSRGKTRAWLAGCAAKKAEWKAPSSARFARPRPAARRGLAAPGADPAGGHQDRGDFAKQIGAIKFFDAGDVQANGFQIVEDDRTGETFTEAGASYMGFAACALLGSAGRRTALPSRSPATAPS
jgi:TctA family transporter